MLPLNENMRYMRLITGYSIREAAEKLGCAASSLSNWENGKISPPADMVQKMCQLYNISADEMFGWKSCECIDSYIAINQDILMEIEQKREQKARLEKEIKELLDMLNGRMK